MDFAARFGIFCLSVYDKQKKKKLSKIRSVVIEGQQQHQFDSFRGTPKTTNNRLVVVSSLVGVPICDLAYIVIDANIVWKGDL